MVGRTHVLIGSSGRLGGPAAAVSLALLCLVTGGVAAPSHSPNGTSGTPVSPGSGSVSNFTAAIGRLVELTGVAGSGILALVWTRVALSWFSSDVTKKIQAKDRARDALIGTLLFLAAVSGMIYGLAHWVVTGS